MTNIEVLHNVVVHYLKWNFKRTDLEGEQKVKYMLENAFRISLGKNYDHSEYCLWLADNAPDYGVIIKDYATLKALKAKHRERKWKHTRVSNQVQIKISSLDINTQVLVILNASEFSEYKLKKLMRSWKSTRPIIMVG